MATITDNPATNGTGDGRMSDGRFAPGNKLSRGNPIHRKMHIMRRALLEAVDTHSVKDVFKKLFELAMAGDIIAIRLYLEYCCGKPHKSIELDFSERSMGRSQQDLDQAQRELDQWNLEQKARLSALLETRRRI
jgi:hypothetical protein